MSIPTGGAGGLAKAAGSGASNTGVSKAAGAEVAKTASTNAAPRVNEAVNASGKSAGNELARSVGFGSGGGFGSAAAGGTPAGLAQAALGATPAGAALNTARTASSVASRLGAGGTSAAGEPGVNDGEVGRAKGSDLGKVAAAGAAVPAAGAAGQLMFAMMVLNWLKSMFFSALAMVANLISMIIGIALTVGKAMVGGAMATGAAVSSFLGGAVSAATAAVSTSIAGTLVLGLSVAGIVTGISNDPAQRDAGLFDCSTDIVAASLSTENESAGVSEEKTLANAKLVYGVLSAWGMSDENIAGILGNWDAESGIDPTGVETIMGEPFALGAGKKAAEDKGFDVEKVAPAYAARFPGVDLLGIGLGQWSNGRNTQLREYAKAPGKWATLETQLGFMISKDSGAPVIKHMIDTPIGSPAAAAIYFHNEWERSADTSTGTREAAATRWFAKMGGWSKNQELADSILAQAGTTVDDANATRVSTAKANCLTGTNASTAGLKEGGLTLPEAEALMATYKGEGDSVLATAFGAGGPGDCGYGKADNCVGFSSYFVRKFTSFKEYARGNGIETAAAMARMMGKETSTTPTPYSVFSMKTGQPEGHTGVVLGIQGDMAVIGEASCGSNHAGTRAFTRPLSELTGGDFVFTDVSDLVTEDAMT